MDPIDLIRINFDEGQRALLNWILAFLMFAVALDIRLEDFKLLLKNPKIILVALSSQLILLPIMTLGLVLLINPAASLALGMILISVCPGGNVSNYMVHIAKANSALSVTLTTITTLAAIVFTPVAFAFWTGFLDLPPELATEISVDPSKMFGVVALIIAVPLAIGLGIRLYFPDFTQKIKKAVGTLALAIFLGFVVFAVLGNVDNFFQSLTRVFFIVLLHNALGFSLGYFWAKLFKLDNRNARTISIETGIQNTGLGLIIVFNFFGGLGGMALILAWWGIWHLFAGFSLANFWRKKNEPLTAPL
ncbi:MAG: bile acid:sodium symporter family protein [Saprospiraceae bacterium]|nr:bile acid:sodium symporter family protein [Saprospiraceae bacterium]